MNRYNQVPHLAQDTTRESDKIVNIDVPSINTKSNTKSNAV